jgi:negative regulator of flagellin synthesis FlgM
MKINGPNQIGNINKYKKSHENGLGTADNRPKKKDQVEISAEAKELLGTQGTASAEKLDRLRSSLTDGTYHVDARKIAEKLLPFIQ